MLGRREGVPGRRHSLSRGRGFILAFLVSAVLLLGPVFAPAVVSAAPASVVERGESGRKQIALTFDGAYSLKEALAVLGALQREQVPATLFLIGSALASYPTMCTEIVRGMAAGLFEVGDHTWSHPHLPRLSNSAIAAQIGRGSAEFRRLTGARTVPLFRPPYGETNARVADVAGSRGFPYLVLWSIDTLDWKGLSASAISSRVLSRVHDGAIVLLHLSAPHTAAAIPVIAGELRARGYELVTVSTMLKRDRLFLDVDPASVAGQAVSRMVEAGIVSGYDANYFGPADTVTRAQMAKVIALTSGLAIQPPEDVASPTFADVPPLRDPHGDLLTYPLVYVEAAAAAGLLVGRSGPDGVSLFSPHTPMTRVQLAQVLARMARELKNYEDRTQVLPTLPPDVPAYAAQDVSLVIGLGLMTGYSAGTFDPWAPAQRGHVALVMGRYLDLPAAPPPVQAD